MSKVVEVTKSGLENDIQNGLTRKEIAAKYGISTGALAKVLKQVGLSNKKPPSVIIKIITEIEEQPKAYINTESSKNYIPDAGISEGELVYMDDISEEDVLAEVI